MPWGKTKKGIIEREQKKAARLLDKGYTVAEAGNRFGKSSAWAAKAGHKYSRIWKKEKMRKGKN